jgi:signal transduction histidine kinase/ligand-binding sensor domain-containing protein
MTERRTRNFPSSLLVLCLVLLASLLAAGATPTIAASSLLSPAVDAHEAPTTTSMVTTVDGPQAQAASAPQGLWFERITTGDGLSFPFVRDILQDRYGFLWIATDSGLNRYDGYGFTVYKEDPSDPTTIRFDDVRAILEDRDGTLWVGGGGGLDRFDRATGTFTHVDTRGQVFSIYEDSAGMLWVGFWHGLYGYDRTTLEIIFSSQPDPEAADEWGARSPTSAVTAIQEDPMGYLWVGTVAGLYRLDRTIGTFKAYRHDPQDPTSLSADNIAAIYADRQGRLWIATSVGGLNGYDPSSDTFVRYRHDPDDPHSLSSDEVLAILQDSAGVLWVGTLNGLDQFDQSDGRFTHHRHDPGDPHSLSEDAILSLFEDRSGVLWVGTAAGLDRYNRREDQFIRYTSLPDLPATPSFSLDVSGLLKDAQPAVLSDARVLALHEDEGGVLWIGTFDGGLNKLDRQSGHLTVYRHDPQDPASLSSNEVGAVFEDHAGVLWVGTLDGWLERFDPKTETFVHHRYLGAGLSALAEDPSWNLWIGTQGEGLYRLTSNRQGMEHYPHFWRDPDHWWRNGSLSSHVVLSLRVDQVGVLWAGTAYGGINLWDEVKGRFTHYRHDPDDRHSLSHDQVLSVFDEPNEGVVWVGTGGGGLNRLDRATQTFSHYTQADGLPGDVVGCILADDAGFLWLGTVRGLSRFDPRTETFRNYDQQDGIGVLSAGVVSPGNCLQSQTGEMFFGGFDGLYAFHPEQIKENPQAPAMAITALKIFNQTVRSDLLPDEHIPLPYQDNFVSFEFAALDYTMPDRNQYAYRMEALDRDWVYAGTRRYADYPDLKPGDYVFRVKGSNSDGVWNEEGVTLRITVKPPFRDTWTFRIMVATALLLAAIGIYRQRVRSVEARSRELKREVEERTHEIERRRQVAEGLRGILGVLNSDQPVDEVLDYIVSQAGQLLGAEAALLHAIEQGRPVVAIQARTGLPDELVDVDAIPFDASGADEAILTRQPHVIPDLRQAEAAEAGAGDDPLAKRWRAVTRQRYRAFLAVPLIVEGEADHCLAFYYSESQAFSDEELELAVALADQAALAIENARLYEHAKELAAVEERQRLARDLHDAVSQTLFSASLIAEALPDLWQSSPEEGQQLLEKLRQLSRGALAEMRALLMELRPSALVDASMEDLLRQLGQAVTGREGIPVLVTVDEPCDLPADVHIALYRIAQEALNNVVKHANASQVEVSLRCISPAGMVDEMDTQAGGAEKGSVVLIIRDNGLGFDARAVSQERLGLGIMRERAAAIGAQLEIEAKPDRGTQVSVIWIRDEPRKLHDEGEPHE